MKKLDLLLKIQNYSVHTQGQISFKSIQMAIKYTVYSLFIFAENFMGSLYVIKLSQKNYVSFRLMSYLVLFIQSLRRFFAIFITPIKIEIKQPHFPSLQREMRLLSFTVNPYFPKMILTLSFYNFISLYKKDSYIRNNK